MIQNNYFTENEDLYQHFERLTDWNEIVDAFENGFEDAAEYRKTSDENLAMAPSGREEALDFYRSVLESWGEIAGKEIAPVSSIMDKKGLRYENGKVIFPDEMIAAFSSILEAGILPISSSRRNGGLGLPVIVQAMILEMVSRADASLALTVGTFNLSETIEKYADEDMIREWVPKMSSGEYCGAMALTEPDYGSNLAGVQLAAAKSEDGKWLLNGNKIFITHGCGFGDRPSVILTLARTGGSGARGLSFFLVDSSDVFVAGIEHKMGIHCSPTCQLVYENTPGLLIGEEGMGLIRYAMGMMNSARISIASQAVGIAAGAFYEAEKYAEQRVQYGKLICEIPAVKAMLDGMRREVYAMRSLLLESSRLIDLYTWREDRLSREGKTDREVRKDEIVRKWQKLADIFTPVVKFYSSEMCVSVASDALQIHGGSGYTEDYDAARIYRDARITPIYEGTSQLQVVGAIGGITAGMSESGNLLHYIKEKLSGFNPSADLLQLLSEFEKAVHAYRSLDKDNQKEIFARDVVHLCARFLCSLLLEESIEKTGEELKEARRHLSGLYLRDSLALSRLLLYRIENPLV